MKAKFFAVAGILSITLCACGTEGNEQKVPDVNGISVNTNIENSESVGIEQKADVSAYYRKWRGRYLCAGTGTWMPYRILLKDLVIPKVR